jgi:hypothetical protein
MSFPFICSNISVAHVYGVYTSMCRYHVQEVRALYAWFVYRCLCFWCFSLGHCVVCPSIKKLINFHGEKGNQNYIEFILRTLFELEEKTAWKKSIYRFSLLTTLFVLLLHRLSWQQTELKLLFIVGTLFFMKKKK